MSGIVIGRTSVSYSWSSVRCPCYFQKITEAIGSPRLWLPRLWEVARETSGRADRPFHKVQFDEFTTDLMALLQFSEVPLPLSGICKRGTLQWLQWCAYAYWIMEVPAIPLDNDIQHLTHLLTICCHIGYLDGPVSVKTQQCTFAVMWPCMSVRSLTGCSIYWTFI